ncbi:hypothetical protein EIN_116300 [Entamoeba invadens IP1]|uniref:Leucine rich repeat containing protein BspA family protein n=1 Tax=Entamoeba invadens IP1 TaxID=370355 RepID=L7FQH3_ENTIV|nr:hypothetical protein EIN_116300 [Entamoeba invadens IP1]ELP94529.1 hypothetical protein EIN_116300 [Entamoeba invadens IP1]|eukprot:XP_004261300.1 hypothetical protein EIN_116300 [Entamoeba invadens IP1]
MSKLDKYNGMIVSSYFKTVSDFIKFLFVCKKFVDNMEKFHYNPVPLTLRSISFFPKIETLCLYTPSDENFGVFSRHPNILRLLLQKPREFFKVRVLYDFDYFESLKYPSDKFDYKKLTFTYTDKDRIFKETTKNVVIPKTVKKLGTESFSSFYKLERVNIPPNVVFIGESCFKTCYNITTLTLPSNLTEIGAVAFATLESLKSIIIPKYITSLKAYTFADCRELVDVELPEHLEIIEKCCFNKCQKLQNVIIPNGVSEIGNNAFEGCAMSQISIPTCLKTIEKFTFYGCKNLVEVKGLECVITFKTFAFGGHTKLNKVEIDKTAILENDAFGEQINVVRIDSHQFK